MIDRLATNSKHAAGVRESFVRCIAFLNDLTKCNTLLFIGTCAPCRAHISLPLGRMSAHSFKKMGQGVAICPARDPPTTAALVSKARSGIYFDDVDFEL